jgi:hypothetical protein
MRRIRKKILQIQIINNWRYKNNTNQIRETRGYSKQTNLKDRYFTTITWRCFKRKLKRLNEKTNIKRIIIFNNGYWFRKIFYAKYLMI